MQSFKAFMVSCLRTDFTNSHNLVTRDTDGIFESVAIPELEQRHIKTDVCWVQLSVIGHFVKKAREMFNVIHGLNYFELNNVRSELTLFSLRILSISFSA